MKRAIATLTATALALGWTTACEPPPPPVSFMVNSDADAADTNPGDGVCETAPATGHCTLTAAIEEGNALGRADIVIPDSNLDVAYPLGDSTVTGRLTITGPPIRPEDRVLGTRSALSGSRLGARSPWTGLVHGPAETPMQHW
jgi:hypothetical protein